MDNQDIINRFPQMGGGAGPNPNQNIIERFPKVGPQKPRLGAQARQPMPMNPNQNIINRFPQVGPSGGGPAFVPGGQVAPRFQAPFQPPARNQQPMQQQQFQRVGAGQYRGPDGRIVNSTHNPGMNAPSQQGMPRYGQQGMQQGMQGAYGNMMNNPNMAQNVGNAYGNMMQPPQQGGIDPGFYGGQNPYQQYGGSQGGWQNMPWQNLRAPQSPQGLMSQPPNMQQYYGN